MARLFADENFPLPVVVALRAMGHDVVTLQELGQGGTALDDASVLNAAAADGRALLTLNRLDFIRLHGKRPDHSGIIVCTFDLDFGGQAQRIDSAIRTVQALAGSLLRVNRPTQRGDGWSSASGPPLGPVSNWARASLPDPSRQRPHQPPCAN